MAMVLVTHDLGVVAGRTDEIAVMYAGKIVEQAPTSVLFAHMRHPYTEALLRSIPRVEDPSHTRLRVITGRPPDLLEPAAGLLVRPALPVRRRPLPRRDAAARVGRQPGPPLRLLPPPRLAGRTPRRWSATSPPACRRPSRCSTLADAPRVDLIRLARRRDGDRNGRRAVGRAGDDRHDDRRGRAPRRPTTADRLTIDTHDDRPHRRTAHDVESRAGPVDVTQGERASKQAPVEVARRCRRVRSWPPPAATTTMTTTTRRRRAATDADQRGHRRHRRDAPDTTETDPPTDAPTEARRSRPAPDRPTDGDDARRSSRDPGEYHLEQDEGEPVQGGTLVYGIEADTANAGRRTGRAARRAATSRSARCPTRCSPYTEDGSADAGCSSSRSRPTPTTPSGRSRSATASRSTTARRSTAPPSSSTSTPAGPRR